SVHETGEAIKWEHPGPASEMDATKLIVAFDRLAAASLIASVYPGKGSRHDFCLALAGFLVKSGADTVLVSEVLDPVVQLLDDPEEITNRLEAVRSTFERANDPDAELKGYRALESILGADVTKDLTAKLKEWLGLPGHLQSDDEQFTDAANGERLAV